MEGEGDKNNREYISDGGHWAGQEIMELFYTPSIGAINQGQEAGGRRQTKRSGFQILPWDFFKGRRQEDEEQVQWPGPAHEDCIAPAGRWRTPSVPECLLILLLVELTDDAKYRQIDRYIGGRS